MKFKILDGKHVVVVKGVAYRYTKGQVLESNQNLVKMFNRPGCRKFEKVHEDTKVSNVQPFNSGPVQTDDVEDPAYMEEGITPQAPQSDIFDTMTVPQLKALAASNELDLEGATRKDEIIALLRGESQGESQTEKG